MLNVATIIIHFISKLTLLGSEKLTLSWYLGQGQGQTWVHMLLFINFVCVYILVIMLSDILLYLQVVSQECPVLTAIRESVL